MGSKSKSSGKAVDTAKNLTPFKKGKSGNPAGKKKGTLNAATVIRRILAMESTAVNPLTLKEQKISYLGQMIYAQVNKAIKKEDTQALKELLDRTEGRAITPVDMNLTDTATSFMDFLKESNS